VNILPLITNLPTATGGCKKIVIINCTIITVNFIKTVSREQACCRWLIVCFPDKQYITHKVINLRLLFIGNVFDFINFTSVKISGLTVIIPDLLPGEGVSKKSYPSFQ
jgi:hypothetical protein